MRKLRLLYAVVGISVLSTITSFASWIQTETTWKYQTIDGNYYNDGWHWIDGNGDNVAECYYFNVDGNMLSNTTTPDNYVVDINGAWVVNGVVQTKVVENGTSSTGSENSAEQAFNDMFREPEGTLGGGPVNGGNLQGNTGKNNDDGGYGNASEYADCIPGYTGPSIDEILADPNTTAGAGGGGHETWN